MTKYYSKTGTQHGHGSSPYKRVSGLTKEEIKMVDSGKNVFITKGVRTHGGNPPERVVRRINNRLVPRVYKPK